MSKQIERKVPWAVVLPLAFAVGMTACGGGGGGTTSSSSVSLSEEAAAGFVVPAEITAVPADNVADAGAPRVSRNLRALARAVGANVDSVSDLPLTSDYHTTTARKFVEMDQLNVFSIIETVLKALKQTNYWEKVGADPYRAIVSFDDGDYKQIMTWTMDVDAVADSNGTDDGSGVKKALVLKAWIPDPQMGTQIRAKFTIYEGADIDSDGTVNGFGRWRMDVAFNEDGSQHFVAEADVEGDYTVLRVNSVEEQDHGSGPVTETRQGVLYRTAETGYGKIFATIYDEGDPTDRDIEYAYNADYITFHVSDLDETHTFDRNSKAEVTWRYGLFDETTGEDVRKTKQFGFPTRFDSDDDNEVDSFGYYGAWRGEHHLWAYAGEQGFALNDGDTVVHEDWQGGTPTQTEYTARFIPSVFQKREMQTSSLSAMVNDELNANFNRFWELVRVAGAWKQCFGWVDFGGSPAVCRDHQANDVGFADFSGGALLAEAGDVQFRLNGTPNGSISFDGANFAGAAFNDGDRLTIEARGDVRLKLTGTAPVAWSKLNPDGTVAGAFTFPTGGDLFLHSNGESYIVKHDPNGDVAVAADYSVLLEVTSTLNPNNADGFLPDGTSYLASPWERLTNRYTYDGSLVESGTELRQGGDVASNNLWTLFAWSDNGTAGDLSDDFALAADGSAAVVDAFGNPQFFAENMSTVAIQFSYRYQTGGGGSEPAQVYLVDADDNLVLLDEPIKLLSVPLADSTSTVLDPAELRDLRYDGWMQGLPDMHEVFKEGGFDNDVAGKVRNVATGTKACTGPSMTGDCYFVKQLETGVFLNEDPSGEATNADGLVDATGIDLESELPTYQDNGMDAMTDGEMEALTVEFVEGKATAAE